MPISSERLQAFSVLAQTLNFSKAGRTLGITQSAVSQRLSKLEEELGTTLLIRDSAHPRLTETGQQLLRYCQVKGQMESDFLASLVARNPGEISGVFRLGGFSSVMRSLALPALAPLLKKHTGLSLTLASEELSDLFSLLKSSRFDAILATRDPGSEELVADFLGYESNVLVESKKYPCPDIYLDHDERDVTTTAYFKLLKKSPVGLKKRYFDDVYGLIDGVKAGCGRAVLPRHLIEGERDLRVVDPSVRLRVPVYLVYYRQPFYSLAHREIAGELGAYFRKKLSQASS